MQENGINYFVQTLDGQEPPRDFSAELRALWLLKKGEWSEAHELVQNLSRPSCAWVHAHLHRVEGDLMNARYWYVRAGKPFCELSLDDEWSELVEALL